MDHREEYGNTWHGILKFPLNMDHKEIHKQVNIPFLKSFQMHKQQDLKRGDFTFLPYFFLMKRSSTSRKSFLVARRVFAHSA